MSESQFAYSGLTLDELRSLAASPQVGTLHAMPQSFRALADRVGEVADLLTHTQVNMHHWWKGPAAEQAAAMLGQAAAEAREFHDTAMGAATAVGHCAQIVSEQQHQMMNVPDVAEPGVTDVVPRPTTPFEALEAARRDAAYQAAHEQAVQVVNGIAAQYVETHARLSAFSTARGENFTTSQTAEPPPGRSLSAGSNAYEEGAEYTQTQRFGMPKQWPEAHWPARSGDRTGPFSAKQRISTTSKSSFIRAHKDTHTATSRSKIDSPTGQPGTSGSHPQSHNPSSTEEDTFRRSSQFEPFEKAPQFEGDATTFNALKTAGQSNTIAQEVKDKPTERSTSDATSSNAGHAIPQKRNAERESDLTQSSSGWQPESRPYLSQLGAAHADNAINSMIPPYSGVGSAHRMHEARNPRPSYLRERKSTWLNETIAAPPDGVLTPEWFEQA